MKSHCGGGGGVTLLIERAYAFISVVFSELRTLVICSDSSDLKQ